jgi:hypothetical protein
MFGVQRRYRMGTKDEAEFVRRMVSFTTTPTASASLMPPHVIERLGLMPALPLGEEPLTRIATYIFEAEFAPPCTHWESALAEQAAAAGGSDGRRDRKMYEQFCR